MIHLIRCPIVARIELQHLAVRADQRCRERVRNGVIGAVGDADVKVLRHLQQHRIRRNGEIPV